MIEMEQCVEVAPMGVREVAAEYPDVDVQMEGDAIVLSYRGLMRMETRDVYDESGQWVGWQERVQPLLADAPDVVWPDSGKTLEHARRQIDMWLHRAQIHFN